MGNKLSVKQKLGFGIFDLGGNMLFTVMGFWCLNYLTDTVGLAAALAGTAVMVGKFWDAVTDPVMGYISDRTLTRWGRRRPYLLFGAIPTALALWFFFTAPGIENPLVLTLWASLTLMLLNTASTVINIPYSSLTPELTDDYHERTSLNGYRFGCAVFGTIIGAAAVQPIVAAFPGQKRGFSVLGLILGSIIALTTLLTFWGTREKQHSRKDIPTGGFFATYRDVFLNRPYVLLLITYALHLMGITFLQGILVYYTKYIYHREELTTPAMVILLLTAMIFIPVSVLVSKRIGKKRTYQICFAILSSACMIIFAIGHILDPNFFLGIMVYAGVGVGFSYVAPFAMAPDAIEYDAVKTGDRKEGAYYGIWTFIAKVGQSLAVFLSGLILSQGGYIADAIQSASSVLAIRIIIGPLPALILIGAMVLIQFYPLDEKTYQALMDREKGFKLTPTS
jgi:GPH family glycoside/pentoside/hexuronide:cation symporter